MKKKILNIGIISVLVIAILFCLTACGDEDSKNSKNEKSSNSGVEDVIEAYYDALNNKDASELVSLLDIDALENVLGETIKKKDLKDSLKDLFEDFDEYEIKISKIKNLKDDDDLLEDILNDEDYDDYDEYLEYVEEQIDKEVVIYTGKLKATGDLDLDELDDLDGKDVIYLTKEDGEYKIVFTLYTEDLIEEAITYNSDYDFDDDYDYDEDPYKYEYDELTADEFNAMFEKYNGKLKGTEVKNFIDDIIENRVEYMPFYIDTYGEDGYLDEISISTNAELEDYKKKIEDSHEYTVEIEPDYYDYNRYVEIHY